MGLFRRKLYNPNAPRKSITLKMIVTIVLLSLGALWFIGSLFGISGIPPIGMVVLGFLIIMVAVLVFNMVYKQTLGNKDIWLLLLLIALIAVGLVFGKTYMPDFFSAAINNMQSLVIP